MAGHIPDLVAVEGRSGLLLACRPIHAPDKTIAAFEILFDAGRQQNITQLLQVLPDKQTIDTYAQIFQRGHIEQVPTLVQVSASALLHADIPPAARLQHIFGIDVNSVRSVDEAEELAARAAAGLQLALTGYSGAADHLAPLLANAWIVSLNLPQLGPDTTAQLLRELQNGLAASLVTGVDTMAQFDACVGNGAGYLQGKFLADVEPVADREMAGNKLVVLRLLKELRNPNTKPATLEQIAREDATLTYNILKGINTAANGLQVVIDSLSQAIALMGTDELRRWAYLMLADGGGDEPDALMRSMLVRGRMCEVLATLAGHEDSVDYFVIGLLSQLNLLMGMTLEALLEQIPLSDTLKAAIAQHKGPAGLILAEVTRYCDGDFASLRWVTEPKYYELAYSHSIDWARQIRQTIARNSPRRI